MNPNQSYGLFYFKQGILLFWFMWFSIACLTNFFDFMIVMQLIPSMPFHSGNYNLLEKIVSIYHTPNYILNVLFSLNILVQGASAILFLTAAVCFWRCKFVFATINIVFGISVALWAVFIIMEEIFIAYSFEPVHIRLFAFELLSLLILHLLPHQKN